MPVLLFLVAAVDWDTPSTIFIYSKEAESINKILSDLGIYIDILVTCCYT